MYSNRSSNNNNKKNHDKVSAVPFMTVPMLPIEELMNENFSRLTTSHHGDL